MTVFDDEIDDANCTPNSTSDGQKGITVWGPFSLPKLEAGGGSSSSWSGTFTCTQPKCYRAVSFCNISYTIHTDQGTSSASVGPINVTFNESSTAIGPRYHSKQAEHDLTETIDVSQYEEYNDPGTNTITFTNTDPSVPVYINDLKIVRGYQMYTLGDEVSSNSPCDDEGDYPANDFTDRDDHPCSHEKCGGLSFTGWKVDDHIKTISSGSTVSWTWTNPPDTDPSSYQTSKFCFFNLNNVTLNGSTTSDDVKFSIRVNSSSWADFYQTKVYGHHQAHGVDLANHSILSGTNGYNDNPGATNTLYLSLEQPAGVDFVLCDGCDDQVNYPCPTMCQGGRVNLYRIYETASLCENPCTCQVGCQICDGTCYGCQAACQFFCVTCDACYGSCQGCQDPCEASCQGCNSYVPCQSCDSCEGCYACNPCQGCQPCETCYSCASCYEDCYEACYEGCYGG